MCFNKRHCKDFLPSPPPTPQKKFVLKITLSSYIARKGSMNFVSFPAQDLVQTTLFFFRAHMVAATASASDGTKRLLYIVEQRSSSSSVLHSLIAEPESTGLLSSRQTILMGVHIHTNHANVFFFKTKYICYQPIKFKIES